MSLLLQYFPGLSGPAYGRMAIPAPSSAASPALGQARAGAAGNPAEGQSYRESCTWQNHCK